MKPIIVEDSVIPKLLSVFISINAITLWPFIISRNKLNEQVLNHEMIHIRQQQELFVVGFYLMYVYYWMKGLWRYKSFQLAYWSIPLEIEAHNHEEDMEYLDSRERFAWRNYR